MLTLYRLENTNLNTDVIKTMGKPFAFRLDDKIAMLNAKM